MDKKGQSLSNGPVEVLTSTNNDNISEYTKVYHLLDELGFSDHKFIFSEHQIRVSDPFNWNTNISLSYNWYGYGLGELYILTSS